MSRFTLSSRRPVPARAQVTAQVTARPGALRLFLLAFAILAGLVLRPGLARAADAQTLVVAGGCFWCVEADFESVTGVSEVVSGYTGGTVANPTYRQVVRGGTGHYEAVRISYDADVVSTRTLLDLFYRSIDPLDAGGQFCDRGESYRTAIFPADAAQQAAAVAATAAAEAELGRDVVTPILPLGPFYLAEDYHQDYYRSSERLAVTSVGLAVPKSVAYERYRLGCGRDARVADVWGPDAPFLHD